MPAPTAKDKAARLAAAKAALAKASPETKKKIADMYPKVSKEDLVKKALEPSKPNSTQTRIAPMQSMTEAKKQEKALNDLMKKRLAVAKKTGVYPNYYTN